MDTVSDVKVKPANAAVGGELANEAVASAGSATTSGVAGWAGGRVTVGMLRKSLADRDVDLPLLFAQPGGIASFQWEAIREETAIVIDVSRDRDLADSAHVRDVGAFLGALAALSDECELLFRPAASGAALYPVVLVELREASTGSSEVGRGA